MTINEFKEIIAHLNRNNGAFYGFETVTHPHLTKKNRTTKEPTDFTVTIRATFSAMLGVSYENAVRNHTGNEEFVAQKPFGKHYIEGSRFLMENDNGGKFYVALDRIGGMKKVIYINDRVATEEEIENLRVNYFDKPSTNTNGVTWRTYGIEGIVSVKQ